MLRIEHLRKHFGNHMVLDDVNLEIQRGEVLCIIGQSGQGKSVILKHIVGLILPDGGRIMLEGQEICNPTFRQADFNKVRHRFGMLFQGAALFDSMTVGENLAFPLREMRKIPEEEINKVVPEALAWVGLHNIENKMSSELSGGMRSRVGLARALVMKPEIMLYDEPTSALDPIMADKINELIIDFKTKLNMTSVVVTHDMGSAYRIADKIAMLNEGKVIFFGTPAEIRASRNPYIQQFISGRRKIHYAVTAQAQEKEAYNRPVDVSRIRKRADVASQLRANRNPSLFDTLTGLINSHTFRGKLNNAFEQFRTTNVPFALVLGDMDFFAEVNDRYSREFGNQVLQNVASEIRNCIRGATDVPARYRDDSFIVIVGTPNAKAVVDTVERIRARVMEEPFETPNGDEVAVTMSFGVTMSLPADESPDALIARVESALQAAQKGGHNRVELIAG
jgi:phospholipid/cholesterol/gamma-HCH transport system ATP-binding protein